MTSPSDPFEPIIVTDTDDLARMFAANIIGFTAGRSGYDDANRLAASLIEIMRANCPSPAAEAEPCEFPYAYFVSYAHRGGFGSIDVCTSSPIEHIDDVDMFRQTIVTGKNPFCLRPEDIVILNFILLSGPKEA